MSIIVGTFNLVSIVGTFRGRLHWILCHQVYFVFGTLQLGENFKRQGLGKQRSGNQFKMVTVPPRSFSSTVRTRSKARSPPRDIF